MLNFKETKINVSKSTQKHLTRDFRFPDTKIETYRKDLRMDSLYNRSKPKATPKDNQ